MKDNHSENAEDYLDDLATAKPGEVLVFDEAGGLDAMDRRRAAHVTKLQHRLVKLTPEVMEKRIRYYRKRLETADFPQTRSDSDE